MNSTDYILSMVTRALDDLSNNSATLSSIIRSCTRVARLRNDFINLWWLEWELVDVTDTDHRAAVLREIVPHFTDEQYAYFRKKFGEEWIRERKHIYVDNNAEIQHDSVVLSKGIGEIELEHAHFARIAEQSVTPTGLHTLDAYFVDQSKTTTRILAQALMRSCAAIIERIKNRVYDFLSQTEKQIMFGQLNADVFERNRAYVETTLGRISPEALAQFVAAYRRMSEHQPESWTHALTSCRRLLKSLADQLYPASTTPVVGADGKSRVLTDSKYVSRLWQYTFERAGTSASGQLLLAQTQDLGNRLDRVYDLSNKGVHADVTLAEADQCVMQTYLLTGDILRIAENDSAIGSESSEGTSPLQ